MAKKYIDPEVNGIILDRGLNDLLLGNIAVETGDDGGVLDISPNSGGAGDDGEEWALRSISVSLPDGSTVVADPTGEILFEDR